MSQKWGFGGFDKNQINSYVLFYLNMKVLIDFLTLCKNYITEKKSGHVVMVKNLLDQSECGIL